MIETNAASFGAVGDGATESGAAISAAINNVSEQGGGTVRLSPGRYHCGTIWLQSGVTLHLEEGAVICGSAQPIYAHPEPNAHDRFQDFGHSHFRNGLLVGENLEHIAICGDGVIDGCGLTRENEMQPGQADKAISLKSCRHVRIEGITVRSGGHFGMLLANCTDVEIAGVLVNSYYDRAPSGFGRDGVNLDSCRRVYLHNSDLRGCDDALAIKSTLALGQPLNNEDIRVVSCHFRSRACNAIRFGSETRHGYYNIHFKDITIMHAGKSGIGLTACDGAVMENISFTNVRMSQVCTPLLVAVAPRGGRIGRIANVAFENIVGRDLSSYNIPRGPYNSFAAALCGVKEQPLSQMRLRNIDLEYPGWGTPDDARSYLPDPLKDGLETTERGIRPGYGLYLRHGENIALDQINLRFERDDRRPPIVCEHVQSFSLSGLNAQLGTDVTDAVITNDVT